MAKLPYGTNGTNRWTWFNWTVGIIATVVVTVTMLYAAGVRDHEVRLRNVEQGVAVINSRLTGIQDSLDRIEKRFDQKP